MEKITKHKLTVVFGSQASNYADSRGVDKAIEMIKAGKLEGSYSTYELDTKADVEMVAKAINDMCGWESSFWQREDDTFEYNKDEKNLVDMAKVALEQYGLETGQRDLKWIPIEETEVCLINGDEIAVFQISNKAVTAVNGEVYDFGEIEDLVPIMEAVAEEYDIEFPE